MRIHVGNIRTIEEYKNQVVHTCNNIVEKLESIKEDIDSLELEKAEEVYHHNLIKDQIKDEKKDVLNTVEEIKDDYGLKGSDSYTDLPPSVKNELDEKLRYLKKYELKYMVVNKITSNKMGLNLWK